MNVMEAHSDSGFGAILCMKNENLSEQGEVTDGRNLAGGCFTVVITWSAEILSCLNQTLRRYLVRTVICR